MTDDFRRPHFIIALLIIGLFGWAFAENVDDDTMKGALIGAFNLAIGFYLGNVVGREKAADNAGKAFDAITAAAAAGGASSLPGGAARAADEVAEAAAHKADQIKGDAP